MTIRRRRATSRTADEIGHQIPRQLHQLPTGHDPLGAYRTYMDQLRDAVWDETGHDDLGLTVAVAVAIGTDPASFYRAN